MWGCIDDAEAALVPLSINSFATDNRIAPCDTAQCNHCSCPFCLPCCALAVPLTAVDGMPATDHAGVLDGMASSKRHLVVQ